MKIGIVGYGWVGKAMYKLFPEAKVYDPYLTPRNATIHEMSQLSKRDAVHDCDIVFICVPTPNKPDGSLDTSIVEKTIQWCDKPKLLVIRSTVNPGDTDRFVNDYIVGQGRSHQRIVVQPEYLGETPAHPMLDLKVRPFLVIGGQEDARRRLIDLYTEVYNANVKIRQVTALEAEVIKLTENRAIAYKVAQCQELYDVCQKAHVDYYTVRDTVYGDDPRFTLWFTMIYPEKRGFNSKCIPKDVLAWSAWAESVGYDPTITNSLLKKNREWINQTKS